LRICGPKREEDGSWRKLHNDELHYLYSSPNIVRVINSRLQRPGPPGWALGVGLTTLLCKNENVEKPPEIGPD
jgi:hypothetical protein